MANRKRHLVLKTGLSKCRKFYYSLETADKLNPAELVKHGFTRDEKEATCEWCIKEILLDRYKAGLIKL